MIYEVIVGNVGTVYRGENHRDAYRSFAEYRKISMAGFGRAGCESVTLLATNARGTVIEREFAPDNGGLES